MQADATFWDSLAFEGIDDVDVEAVTAAFGTVDVKARGRAAGAACPDCGRSSNRGHDSYQRRLKDLPLAEPSVVIHLTVRRFICGTDNCPRRTFAEPFAQLTAPYARFTTRLGHVLERLGLALAGRAGAWLTAHLGFPVGRMTLLRKVIALPDPQPSTPRVLGVDDFATRRGQTYSTVLTCGETHRVVDVLPTRDSGPLAVWLATHPGVEIIFRDRAGAHAEGARLGAPAAIQVADRFHLWQGIGRAFVLVARSSGRRHSERMIGTPFLREGEPARIRHLYTERAPCTTGANCSSWMAERFSVAEVSYSVEYGDKASRERVSATMESYLDQLKLSI